MQSSIQQNCLIIKITPAPDWHCTFNRFIWKCFLLSIFGLNTHLRSPGINQPNIFFCLVGLSSTTIGIYSVLELADKTMLSVSTTQDIFTQDIVPCFTIWCFSILPIFFNPIERSTSIINVIYNREYFLRALGITSTIAS